jgi:hypothetical protein
MIETCYKRHKTTVNPIIDWTDSEIWEFIRAEGVPYCVCYDEGFTRLGCIGCPMARRAGREREFRRWPTYKTAYLRAFDKMLKYRAERGKMDGTWRMGTRPIDVFNWWMEYDVLPGQVNFFEEGADEYEWIPVTEKLPDELIDVRCRTDEGHVVVGLLIDIQRMTTTGYACATDGGLVRNITHWMPLPEPPKEG